MIDKSANPARPSSFWPILIGIGLISIVLFQFKGTASLRSEMAALRALQESAPKGKATARPSRAERAGQSTTLVVNNSDTESRLYALEEDMAALNNNASHLMDRGQVPPTAEKSEEWKVRFLAFDTPTRTMFGTLRLLRSNDLFDDVMAAHVATLLSQSTNNGTIRALIGSLRGAENEALKPAMLALAIDSKDARVRDAAVGHLRYFVSDDPTVEAALWKLAASDESRNVRSEAEGVLRRIPMTDTRQAELSQRVANANLPFDERWSAFRVLGSSKGTDISDLAYSLAQSSEYAPSDEDKMSYIRAFDDVNNDHFMLPLVNLIQDPNADVRLRAANALMDYKNKDPNVKLWLKVLADSDPDPRVRKEAMRAFAQTRTSRTGRTSR